MMSSDGCSARQSMYSPNWSPSTKFSVTSMGWPASVRRLASVLSRTDSWSCSGIPSSMPITRMGIWAPRSAMKSNPPAPTRGSRERTQNSRIFGSSSATRRGEKTRDSSRRCMVWTGGSSKMSTPGGISMLARISSMMPPRPEMNVFESSRLFSTSVKRVSA